MQNAIFQDEAVMAPIFGHEEESRINGLLGMANVNRCAVEADFARSDTTDAEQRLGQLGAAGADETRHANNLAALQRKRNGLGRTAGEDELFHLEANRGVGLGARGGVDRTA